MAAAPEDATDGPAAELTPVVPPEPVVPAEDQIQKQKAEDAAVLKSTLAELLKAALEPLEKRLATVEGQPMPGGPMLNGAVPGSDGLALRGQAGEDQEASLRKSLADEKDPVRKQEIQQGLLTYLVQHAPRLQ